MPSGPELTGSCLFLKEKGRNNLDLEPVLWGPVGYHTNLEHLSHTEPGCPIACGDLLGSHTWDNVQFLPLLLIWMVRFNYRSSLLVHNQCWSNHLEQKDQGRLWNTVEWVQNILVPEQVPHGRLLKPWNIQWNNFTLLTYATPNLKRRATRICLIGTSLSWFSFLFARYFLNFCSFVY